jgi:hypothetical protein
VAPASAAAVQVVMVTPVHSGSGRLRLRLRPGPRAPGQAPGAGRPAAPLTGTAGRRGPGVKFNTVTVVSDRSGRGGGTAETRNLNPALTLPGWQAAAAHYQL